MAKRFGESLKRKLEEELPSVSETAYHESSFARGVAGYMKGNRVGPLKVNTPQRVKRYEDGSETREGITNDLYLRKKKRNIYRT